MHSLQQQIESLLCPHGFEVHPFLTGWYNQLVAPKFHLDHPEDTLAFVIISQPALFEKAFLPFLSSHYRPGLAGRRDPIDECMLHQLSRLASVSASVVTLHDFQLTSSRRPRVLVQTAGHVAGAVTFYQPQVTRAQASERRLYTRVRRTTRSWRARSITPCATTRSGAAGSRCEVVAVLPCLGLCDECRVQAWRYSRACGPSWPGARWSPPAPSPRIRPWTCSPSTTSAGRCYS